MQEIESPLHLTQTGEAKHADKVFYFEENREKLREKRHHTTERIQ